LFVFNLFSFLFCIYALISPLGGNKEYIYLVGEGVILVGDQQDGGKKRQISTPVSAFSAIEICALIP